MPTLDWKTSLIEQMTFAWEYLFTPRMADLTDDEYVWAPVADVWTVHPGTDGGPNTIDWDPADPKPAPFTTIAWRMHHMTDFFTKRWVGYFGDGSDESGDQPVRLTAEEGMADLTAAYTRWRDSLLAAPSERFGQPCGPAEGPNAEAPFAELVIHINREFIHHAAECALLRDLYRQRDTLA